jgi:hypothetical protein
MLSSQALSQVLQLWTDSKLPQFPLWLVHRAQLVLAQSLYRTLQTILQLSDKSRNISKEETAYSIITLATALRMSIFNELRDVIESGILKARILLGEEYSSSNCIWVEKVTYSVHSVSEAYILSALKISEQSVNRNIAQPHPLFTARAQKLIKFFSKLPLYSSLPSWVMKLSYLEAALFEPKLRELRLNIFPRAGMAEDKYFEYIPLTWTAANASNASHVSNSFLHEMMVISFLNYQVDEYMESVATVVYGDDLDALEVLIENILGSLGRQGISNEVFKENDYKQALPSENGKRSIDSLKEPNGNSHHNGESNSRHTKKRARAYSSDKANEETGILNRSKHEAQPFKSGPDHKKREAVIGCLSAFIRYIVRHEAVIKASSFDRANVINGLRTFLAAHIQQAKDNAYLSKTYSSIVNGAKRSVVFERPGRTFFDWVHTTSSDHTSCPYSFFFVLCLLSKDGQDCFETPAEKYASQSLCRHLAIMCRMYNDYGSVLRDSEEFNLNSLNFPEFVYAKASNGSSNPMATSATLSNEIENDALESAKEELLAIAQYERVEMEQALRRLQAIAGTNPHKLRVIEVLKMFCDVTDSYGQIYMARDIASRMKFSKSV